MSATSDPQKLDKIYDVFNNIDISYDSIGNVSKIKLFTNNNDIYDISVNTDQLCCEQFSNKIFGNIDNIENLAYITVSINSDHDKFIDKNNKTHGYMTLETFYINFHMKDNSVSYLRNICITNGYYPHYIKLLKNNKLLFKTFV